MTTKLHKEVVSDYTFNLLKDIQTNPNFDQFYLAGGTSLALLLGHRISIDLDFFTNEEFSTNLIKGLNQQPDEIVSLHHNSIEIWLNDVKLFFFYYGFPLTQGLVKVKDLVLANPIDVGLMKLLALQGRTTRKDIIDLYFIDKEIIKLENLLELFEQTYPQESFNSYDSLKTLLDTTSLSLQPMPNMLLECEWEKCLELVSAKVRNFVKNLLSK